MALRAPPAALTAACSGALPASLRCRARCARPRGAALRVAASQGNTPERESLYETLGVAPGASAEAVKRAFRRLALRHHPDVSQAADAPSHFQQIRSAYEALLAGGGAQQRPWWRARWLEQLKGLRTRISEKVAALRKRRERAADAVAPHASEAERAAAEAAEAELRRKRVESQLSGLQQRSQRRGRRRPPSSANRNEW